MSAKNKNSEAAIQYVKDNTKSVREMFKKFIFKPKTDQQVESTSLADFIKYSKAREKKKVINEVVKESNQDQREIDQQYKKMKAKVV